MQQFFLFILLIKNCLYLLTFCSLDFKFLILFFNILILHESNICMHTIEVKFLFEGIIFSSHVFVRNTSKSLNHYEFSIRFFTNYLISKYSKGYNFILENNTFMLVDHVKKEEIELIKTIRQAISKIPPMLNNTLLA